MSLESQKYSSSASIRFFSSPYWWPETQGEGAGSKVRTSTTVNSRTSDAASSPSYLWQADSSANTRTSEIFSRRNAEPSRPSAPYPSYSRDATANTRTSEMFSRRMAEPSQPSAPYTSYSWDSTENNRTSEMRYPVQPTLPEVADVKKPAEVESAPVSNNYHLGKIAFTLLIVAALIAATILTGGLAAGAVAAGASAIKIGFLIGATCAWGISVLISPIIAIGCDMLTDTDNNGQDCANFFAWTTLSVVYLIARLGWEGIKTGFFIKLLEGWH